MPLIQLLRNSLALIMLTVLSFSLKAESLGFDEKPMRATTLRDTLGWSASQWYYFTFGLQEGMWITAGQFKVRGNYWEYQFTLYHLRNYFSGVRLYGSVNAYNLKLADYIKKLPTDLLDESLSYFVLETRPQIVK